MPKKEKDNTTGGIKRRIDALRYRVETVNLIVNSREPKYNKFGMIIPTTEVIPEETWLRLKQASNEIAGLTHNLEIPVNQEQIASFEKLEHDFEDKYRDFFAKVGDELMDDPNYGAQLKAITNFAARREALKMEKEKGQIAQEREEEKIRAEEEEKKIKEETIEHIEERTKYYKEKLASFREVQKLLLETPSEKNSLSDKLLESVKKLNTLIEILKENSILLLVSDNQKTFSNRLGQIEKEYKDNFIKLLQGLNGSGNEKYEELFEHIMRIVNESPQARLNTLGGFTLQQDHAEGLKAIATDNSRAEKPSLDSGSKLTR